MNTHKLYPHQTLYFFHKKENCVQTVEVVSVNYETRILVVRWNDRDVERDISCVEKTLFFTEDDANYYHEISFSDEELLDEYESPFIKSSICEECKMCARREGPDECFGASEMCDRFVPIDYKKWLECCRRGTPNMAYRY